MIVDLRAQIPVLVAAFIAPAEAPVHVDIPDETIDCLNHARHKVDPESSVWLVLEAHIFGASRTGQPEAKDTRQYGAEILARIHEVDPLAGVVIPIDALPEAEPVWQDAEHIIEVVRGGALTIFAQLGFDPRLKRFLLEVALDVKKVLKRARHGSDDIGQEKVTEPHFAERGDEYVPEGLR